MFCTVAEVVPREVGEDTVVTMQGSCLSVVSSRDSALMNWGCSSTWSQDHAYQFTIVLEKMLVFYLCRQ